MMLQRCASLFRSKIAINIIFYRHGPSKKKNNKQTNVRRKSRKLGETKKQKMNKKKIRVLQMFD